MPSRPSGPGRISDRHQPRRTREEEEDQHQAEQEVRQRAGQHAVAEGDVLEHPNDQVPGAARGDDGEWNQHQEDDEQREEDELQRYRNAADQIVRHLRVVDPGFAEITLEGVLQPDHVLLGDRPVQIHLGAQRLDRGFWRKGAKREARGVARQQAHQYKGDERDQKDLGYQEKKAAPDIECKAHSRARLDRDAVPGGPGERVPHRQGCARVRKPGRRGEPAAPAGRRHRRSSRGTLYNLAVSRRCSFPPHGSTASCTSGSC